MPKRCYRVYIQGLIPRTEFTAVFVNSPTTAVYTYYEIHLPEVAVLWTFFFFLRTPPVRVAFAAPPNRLAIMRSRAAMMSEPTSSAILTAEPPVHKGQPKPAVQRWSQSHTAVMYLEVPRGLRQVWSTVNNQTPNPGFVSSSFLSPAIACSFIHQQRKAMAPRFHFATYMHLAGPIAGTGSHNKVSRWWHTTSIAL